ncbi:LOW QUALITY PROTEIN: hypothetical protein O9K51_09301 [Purpureocillium lavendulum]|uniref:TFIIIC transcription initiation factor complex subunits Tfc3 n=1 Tax=Purpureocillium lavendulum TaxID=1247861 RepID=A0AB34FIQ1_9HYPO|nr:LOW QUALITY PROTEIN: hypothetical protein O9K51_09301 [Purpureocillium lavendulum]
MEVRVSEATMWETITGHAVDHKRIPRSEWVLLLGIASTGSSGILQGDLGRLVAQDKRSVPKRTDSLVRKGYIIKRTTLVRGTKTSKMWLKSLAPSLPRENVSTAEPVAEMSLNRQSLVDNLDPVPWHIRWTGADVDYTALATTVMAIAKEWDVIRMHDLKAKLGILEMRWQMKVLSKTCRFLNSRGAIQYVAAKLDNKVFKDCIKFCRDLNPDDWSIFLATGKRAGRPSRSAAEDDFDDETNARRASSLRLSTLPPWESDQPLPWTIARLVQVSSDSGLSNPDIYSLTLGATFNRFLSAMTGSMATPGLQPPYLRHMQLRSEHARSGKVASYLFFPQSKADTAASQSASEDETSAPGASWYGLGPAPNLPMTTQTPMSLARVCGTTKPLALKANTHILWFTCELHQKPSAAPSQWDFVPLSLFWKAVTIRCNTKRTRMSPPSQKSMNMLREMRVRLRPPLRPPLRQVVEAEARVEAVDAVEGEAAAIAAREDARRGPFKKINLLHGHGNKCGGSWKNDLGLKYHLEKSRTSCNPSYTPSDAPTTRRGKPMVFFDPAISEPIDKGGSEEEKSMPETTPTTAPEKLAASTLPVKRPPSAEEHRETVGSPSAGNVSTVQTSRVTPAGSADHSTTPVAEQSPFIQGKHGQEALLETAASLPRRNLVFATRAPSVIHDSGNFGQPTGSESVSTSPAVEADLKVVGTGHTTESSGRYRRNRTNKATFDKVSSIIQDLVAERGGAVIGGSDLLQAVLSSWNNRYPAETAPSDRDFQTTLRDLIKRKVVVDQWHAFRGEKGLFSKCQLITRPDLDAFAPESLQLIEKLKSATGPFRYMTSCEDANSDLGSVTGGKVRGRRPLADEVAILDAPVYAAQVAAKRAGDAESPRRVKRLRYSVNPKMEEGDGLGPVPKRRKGRRLKFEPGEWGDGPATPSDVAQFFPAQWSTQHLTFLKPNTRLDDELAPQARAAQGDTPWLPGRRAPVPGWNEPLISNPVTHTFDEATRVVGSNGVWPWYSNAEIDGYGTSLVLDGWMPDKKWFEWSAIDDHIEERLAAPNLRKHLSVAENRNYERFLRRLRACLDVELSRQAQFVKARPGEAGPHNIFVKFHGDPFPGITEPLPDLVWQPEGQLTLISARDTLANKLDDGASSSDDDLGVYTRRALPSPARTPVADGGGRSARQAKVKRVALVTRALTALPARANTAEQLLAASAEIDNRPELLAAFIAIRSVLGGADKAIDWGLLMKLYPHLGLVQLRRFWTTIRKEQAAYISNFTHVFQEKLISAFESEELPVPDFEKPLEYDWNGLIRWTMQLPRQDGFQMPRSREILDQNYTLDVVQSKADDWRERYFHVLTSTYSRFEAVTMDAGAVTVMGASNGAVGWPAAVVSNFDVAKSWIKSLCSTGDSRYSSEQIKAKFHTLCPGNKQRRGAIFRQATSQLTDQKIICRSKKALLGGRPYRLNEWYVANLGKLAQSAKYDEAALFKAQLDEAFRTRESMSVPYTLSEGAMMALTNLNGAGRVRLVPVGLPNIPLGFEPGNYESRKYPKSYYHFGVDVVPTETYKFNEDIDVLQAVLAMGPPTGRPGAELPQWVDFFGTSNIQLWSEILGAFCFAFAIRGTMTKEGIRSALHPTLDDFEAQLIMQWGHRTGVLVDALDGSATTVGEWWWLAVPWLRNELVS